MLKVSDIHFFLGGGGPSPLWHFFGGQLTPLHILGSNTYPISYFLGDPLFHWSISFSLILSQHLDIHSSTQHRKGNIMRYTHLIWWRCEEPFGVISCIMTFGESPRNRAMCKVGPHSWPKNVFHFLSVITHGLILSSPLSEYTYSLAGISGVCILMMSRIRELVYISHWNAWKTTPLRLLFKI